MSQVPPDFIRSYVDERFPDPPPRPPTYKLFPSLLSIGSLIFMTMAATYMAQVLDRPNMAYNLVKTSLPVVKRKGGKGGGPIEQEKKRVVDKVHTFFDEAVCLFPAVLYTDETSSKFFSECNKEALRLGDESAEPKGEKWTLLPFYFTIYGAGLGALFEIYLLLTGHAFQQRRSNFTTWISRLRTLNLAFVSSTIFFFSAALIVKSEEVGFLKLMLALSIFMLATLAPGLYWGGFRISGGNDLLPPTLLLIQIYQFIFVVRF